jgi:hypothetical protein
MGRADGMSKASEMTEAGETTGVSETTGVRYLGAGEKARTQSLMETEDVR